MPYRFLGSILVLSLFAAPAAQGQDGGSRPPHELEGAWELAALNGWPLPLTPVRDGGDPSECGDHGEYAGQRVGEGQLVIRTSEMWRNPRSERWTGGIYVYVPAEILCRAQGGAVIALRRDEHNQARPAHEVEPRWRAGSYGMEDSLASLSAGDHAWRLAAGSSGEAGTLTLEDEEGTAWTFRRAAPDPRFETPGFATVLGDFDGDGHGDQVSVTPGRHGTGTMIARLAEGAVDRVADVPLGAEVRIAPRGRVWRNADGTTLRITDRDAVIVSVEPAPGRSDVTVYYIRNEVWVAWAYAPD
jgi:hypothetical protein